MSPVVPAQKRAPASPQAAPSLSQGEQPFWTGAGAIWKQLAGGFKESGFSFEWHEWKGSNPLHWSNSFHPGSIEICLNVEGQGWISNGTDRMQFEPGSAGFFILNGTPLEGRREGGQRHRFVSVEFRLSYLRERLSSHGQDLHPLLRACLDGVGRTGLSEVTPLSQRRQELLNSLLHPPVLKAAQRLWFESKALEFASEFFFRGEGSEMFCSRAQRLIQERVRKAQQILLENLAEPPSLEELGRRVACSQFYLSRTFTQETGLTISQWLRRARLQRAAELLQSGKCNVTEAALEVGYSSLSHFSLAFHEMFGCCPGLYPLKTPAQNSPLGPRRP